MDQKLLQALNNLSFALDTISDLLSKKSDKKTDTAKALSSSDLSKQFEALNKSLKQNLEESKKENKRTQKDTGFDNLSKKINELGSSVNALIKNNNKILALQKSLSEIKPEVVITETSVKLPKIKPIEVPLRYGKLEPLKLPIPKPIVISFTKPTIPSIPKVEPQIIDLKFSKLPTIPKLPKTDLTIDLRFSELPKLPTLQNLIVKIEYGEFPNLPNPEKQLIQTIQLEYGEIPTLPKLASFGEQIIPIKYQESPSLPELTKFDDQIINIKYGPLPTLPKLASFDEQIIEVKYGEIPSPKLSRISQFIDLEYATAPKPPKLVSVPVQMISLEYGTIPKLPLFNKVDQKIHLLYGEVPNLPKLSEFEKQIIPLKYGEIPNPPTLSALEQSIELRYGSAPEAPELENQIINLEYGDIPKSPDLNILSQEIGLKYSEPPTIPKLAEIEPQTIGLKYGESPTLPKLANILQTVNLVYGPLPILPKLAVIKPQEIQLIYGKIPNAPKLQSISQEIILKYGKIPNLPKLAQSKSLEIPLKFGKLPSLPKMSNVKPITIPVEYQKVKKFIPPKSGKVMIPTEYEKPKGKIQKTDDGGGLFGKAGDQKNTQSIKDGAKMIVLIAGAVLAIGLAFKIVGGINFASVIGLAAAISILTISFSKLAEAKNLTPGRVALLTTVIIGISLAVLASSFILSAVKPVGILQLFTSIMIAGMFTAISYGLGNLLLGISKITGKALLMIPLLPFIMVGISLAITASSFILSAVKPIGFFQAITAILIAGVFAVISYGLGNLLVGLGKLNLKSIALIPLLPLILVAISAAIVGSSFLLAKVKPIGIFQAFTAIFIGLVFAAVSYGLGQIIKGLSEIKNPAQAALIAAILPLVMIGIAAAITGSSYLFAMIKPVGIFKLFTAIMIGIAFIPIAYAVSPILKAIQNVDKSKLPLLPVVMLAMALTITATSYIFSLIKPVSFGKLLTAIGISLTISIIGLSLGYVLDKISKYKESKIKDGAKNLIIIAATLVAVSFILAVGQYTKYPSITWLFFTSLALITYGGAIYALDKLKLTTAKVEKGAKSILIIAATIMVTSLLLSVGQYSKYPSFIWSLGVAVSFAVFGGVIAVFDKLKITLSKVEKGAKSILILAGTILATSLILTVGKYDKYPAFMWSLGVAVSLVVFGGAIMILDQMKITVQKVTNGAKSIIIIAGTILATSFILSAGNYSKYPEFTWVINTAVAMAAYGFAIYLLDKFKVTPTTALKGGIAMVLIAGTILATSLILAEGNYGKYPSLDWTLNTAAAMIPFGIAAVILGTIATSGVGAIAIAAGLVSIIAIAGTILAVDAILANGSYSKYPSFMWTLGTAAAMVPFGLAAVLLGTIAATGVGAIAIASGLVAIIAIAGTVLAVDAIISQGNYSKPVPPSWTLGTAAAIIPFGLAAVFLGPFLPLLALGGLAILGISYVVVKTAEILGTGDYTKFPSVDWAKGVGLTLAAFATGMGTLGAIIAGSFGLGAVALALGGEAVLGVAQSVVDASNILAKGNYKSGPTLQWASGVAIALGSFSEVYKMLVANAIFDLFGGGGIGPKEFGESIVTISKSINTAANELSKGTFTGGPTMKWASGVAIAIGAFSSVYKMLLDNAGPSFFASGVSPEQFSTAIVTISKGIKSAAFELAQGTEDYKKGPTKEWSEGVALALGGFAPIYKILADNAGIWSSGVSVDDFRNAIVSISQGITTAAEELGKGTDQYKKGPTKQWAEGVSTSLQAFTGVFQALGANSGWFTGGLKPEDYQNAIKSVGMGLAEAARAIGGENVSYDLSKVPKKEWGQAVNDTFQAFIPALKYINDQSGWFSDGAETTVNSMKAIAGALKDASITLRDGDYTVIIDPKWSEGIKLTFEHFLAMLKNMQDSGIDFDDQFANLKASSNVIVSVSTILSRGKYVEIPKTYMPSLKSNMLSFVSLLKGIESSDISDDNLKSVKDLSTSLKDISIILSRGNFSVVIPENWMKSLTSNLVAFSTMIQGFNSGGLLSFFEDSTTEKVSELANGIISLAEIFNSNKVPFDIKKVPSIQWSQGFSTAMTAIMPGLNYVSENSGFLTSGEDKFKSGVSAIAEALVGVSRKLATGRFDKIINPNYFQNLATNINSYLNILKTVEQSNADYDSVSDMADSMVELAKAYDRLGQAVMNLNGQIGGVDMEKMTLLKNLAGSVVMLSLMDSTQFESMMDALESKAKILTEVVEDTAKSAPAEAAKGQSAPATASPGKGTQKGGAGGATTPKVTTPTVKVKPAEPSESEMMMKQLASSMGALQSAVSQIAQVISGGGGVTLKTYMESKMKTERKSLVGK
jgi:hypothetical protein